MNTHENAPRSGIAVALGYTLMIAAVVAAYLGIRWYGDLLSAPAPLMAAATGAARSSSDVMLHVLLALIVVIVMARGLGTLFRSVHQPPVIGEIIAGIVLGPSLLGRLAPGVSAYVLPGSVAPFLNVIAQVGVILYMFLVGLELDPALLRKRGHATVAISHASILAPFLLGAVLALLLYPRLSSSDVPFTGFSLFLGVSMSVTAFPVLARILTDRGIHKTRMGAIALTCAAVDDVTAWCLLAFVVSVVEARTAGALSTVVTALVFIAAMVIVVRPAMVRLSFLYGNRGADAGRDGRGVRGAAALGADHRLHRHPRHLRRLRPGRGHPARQRPGARADRSPGRPGGRAAAARVLRLHRTAHADRIGERRWGVAAVRPDHRDRVAGQIRRRSGRGPPDRARLARLGRARRADEHARPDGTDRAQHRLRTRA